jgi:tRNA nucleotidyltransferase (CCA-adding enzyme)
MKLFRRTVPIGIDHGTVGRPGGGHLYEVTTFRRDVETFGRHAVVEFADRVEDDLARRDFTINALAWHPPSGRLLDPFGGRADLEARRLRTVGSPGDRFAEDYLRVLRALRFAGQFELSIEPATWDALRAAVPISAALRRAGPGGAGQGPRPDPRRVARPGPVPRVRRPCGALPRAGGPGGRAARRPRPGSLDAHHPRRRRHPAGGTTLRLAALLHGIGMPPARTRDLRGGWRYTGHEVLGARKAEDVMRRLKASNAETERVTRWSATSATCSRRTPRMPACAAGCGTLASTWWPTCSASASPSGAPSGRARTDRPTCWNAGPWFAACSARPPLSVGDLAIGGRELQDMGLRPGPRFGEILDELLERVMDDPSLNEPGGSRRSCDRSNAMSELDLFPGEEGPPGGAPSPGPEPRVDPRAPLAARMRPLTLDDFVGQESVLGPGRRCASSSRRTRWGASSSGARPAPARRPSPESSPQRTAATFVPFSAVTEGVPRVREIVKEASARLRAGGRRTILFCDEIHRFNKAQQDAFLPHVEAGPSRSSAPQPRTHRSR